MNQMDDDERRNRIDRRWVRFTWRVWLFNRRRSERRCAKLALAA